MPSLKRIGIAVVEHEGRYLVGVRGPSLTLAGYAEFPGGKAFDGETAEECAVRECREETGLEVFSDRLLQQREFEYPHARVDLHFVLCHPVRALDACQRHHDFEWVAASELTSFNFPAANGSVVELLTGSTKLSGFHSLPEPLDTVKIEGTT